MPAVFADTGYWIALLNPGDDLHARATELSITLEEQVIITTEMVWTEFLNHVTGWGSHMCWAAAQAVTEWRNDPNVEVIEQSGRQFEAALARYQSRLDQAWSLVDCSSFIVMEERGIRDALAFDRHFEQAGFTPLLREK